MKDTAQNASRDKLLEQAEMLHTHAGAFGLTIVAHLLKEWPLEGVNKGDTDRAALRVNYFTFIMKHMLLYALIDKFHHDNAKGRKDHQELSELLMNHSENKFFAARDMNPTALEHGPDSPFTTGPFTPFAGTTLENLAENKELARTPVLVAARLLAREFNRPGDQAFLDRAKVLGLSGIKQLLSVHIRGYGPRPGFFTRARIFLSLLFRALTGRLK